MKNKEGANFHVRLPEHLLEKLKKTAALRGITRSSLIVSALNDALCEKPPIDEKTIGARLLRLERNNKHLRSDLEVTLEVLFHYIFHWFCYTPPLSENDKASIISAAEERYERFMELLRARFERGEFRTAGIIQGKDSLQSVAEKKDVN